MTWVETPQHIPLQKNSDVLKLKVLSKGRDSGRSDFLVHGDGGQERGLPVDLQDSLPSQFDVIVKKIENLFL